nr:uncharacterized protein LOC104086758 [Nicotiana tomentosiformis]
MNPNSATGPDGMNEKFYQACWDIIKNALLNMVLDFFGGLHQSSQTSSLPTRPILSEEEVSLNIMLDQEIVQGIKKPNIGANVVIKLDMAKAYDRVSWSFTCIMLRRMGFNEMIIYIIQRTMSNNW